MNIKLVNLFEYESLAKQRLSQIILDYYASGAWDEVTLLDNRRAFDRYKLYPRMLVDVSQQDLSTKILGQQLDIPLLIAPMAFQCLADVQGELATATSAAALGAGMVLSTMSTKSLEEVATTVKGANFNHLWFQLYIHRDRSLTRALVQRAEAAGFNALCLTVDVPVLGCRERDRQNNFTLPSNLELANLSDRKIPAIFGESGVFAYVAQQFDPGLTWKDIDWLRSLTKLPLVVKGILRADDAVRSVEHGVQGVIVSNHGGRQLDGAIATIDALSDVVAAVGEQVDVLVDSGFRRGTDILKALALGAKAVLVGRPVLWGLSVAGETGVRHVLEILRDELGIAMALSGCRTIQEIDVSLIKQV
ncbi:alpha-hydroxy-acid oxidizing enzyme [Nostoc sp. RF31YmG]|nr:alpha-hydroxy-acid oxidizing enzyme [Nostoc sp. RF31YmG]